MYRSMNARSNDVEIPTTALYVKSVIERATCPRHEAGLGSECFWFESLISDSIVKGICNERAHKAGMNGYIRRQSLTMASSGTSFRHRG